MYRTLPLSRLQLLNARNMHASLAETAPATLFAEVEAEALLRARAAFGSHLLAVDPFLLFAVARALRQHPTMNARVSADELCLFDEVNLGVLVARDDGVLVPVLRDVLAASPEEVLARLHALTASAHSGRLQLQDTRGATFTVVDFGRHTVDGFTPILPAGQVGILGAGRLRTGWGPGGRPQPVITLSLTFDHRATHGPAAARFMDEVARELQHPVAVSPHATS